MPSYYGSLYGQPSEATLAAQRAAEKAASGATTKIAPRVVLTPEQRQANIARDLALSQTRGARPSGQDSQFYQPVYQSQYQNYANPLTAFNVSNYGTNPGMSTSMQAAMAPGAGGVDPYYKQLQSYANLLSSQGGRNNINTLMEDMQKYGISAQDLQNASSYTPQQQYNRFVDPSTGRATGLADPPQMQTPFSYQQPMQQRQAQFNPYTNQYQTPFSYQQPQYQQQQMQSPFSYQQYQPQQQYNRFVDPSTGRATGLADPPQMMQPMQQPAQTNYGPSQAIVGRSSQMRGTPSVMRRAKGGIASLLKKHK